MAKSKVRLDKVKAVKSGNIFSVVAAEELQNGFVGVLGDLETGEREIYELVKPATATLDETPVVLVASPEVNYNESGATNRSLGAFSIAANETARAYELQKYDIFSVSVEGVTALATTPVVGNYVTIANGTYKLAESTTATTNAFTAEIIGLEEIGVPVIEAGQAGYGKFVVCQVVKNG